MPTVAERAHEVAHDLMGTCRDLEEFATQDEINDAAFCAELDMHVACCASCEWWCEPCELNDDDKCEDCVG